MTAAPGPARGRDEHDLYFLLNYARSLPSTLTGKDQDVPVRLFFEDLCAEVYRFASAPGSGQIGFYDGLLRPGADPRAAVTTGIQHAEVLVALYSPRYVSQSWPRRVDAAFRSRLPGRGAADPGLHVAPVLWTPLPSWAAIPGLDQAARALGEGIPEYAENGLRALQSLKVYRTEYREVLQRLAQRIVSVAEQSPLGPSPSSPVLDDVPDGVEDGSVLAVATLRPVSEGQNRAGLSGPTYPWRPFGHQQELAVDGYAAAMADQMGLRGTLVDFGNVRKVAEAAPVVALVDPWLLADPHGADTLRAAFEGLPGWVLPLVVVDRADNRTGAADGSSTDQALAILRAAHAAPAGSCEDLEDLEPALRRTIAQAQRAHLRHVPAPVDVERNSLRETTTPAPDEATTGTDQTGGHGRPPRIPVSLSLPGEAAPRPKP